MDCSIEVKRIHLLHQDGRLPVVSSVTAPASLSNQESGASIFTTVKGAKELQTFSGNALEFKEWVFAMDLVMRSLAIDDTPYFAVTRHPCANGPPYLCFAAGTVPNQLLTNLSPKS